MPQFNRSSYIYTPLFCEENIWKLVESLYTNRQAMPIDVLFILNETSSIALFEQKPSKNQKPVIWDYHVILSAHKDDQIMIFDFDSCCKFPQTIKNYFDLTFPRNVALTAVYQPLIKPIKAEYFLEHFHSDRTHMSGIIDDSAYPKYQIITPEENTKKLTLAQCRNTESLISTNELQLPHEYLKN